MLSLDGTLGKKEQQKRTLFFTINVVITVMHSMLTVVSTNNPPVKVFASILTTVASLLSVLNILCKRTLTNLFVIAVGFAYLISIMAADLSTRTIGSSTWGLFVLVVDFLLVMEVDTRHAATVVVICCVWVSVTTAEMYFRFGLFDVPGLLPQHGEGSRWELYRERGSCTDLPCSDPESLASLVFAIEVFVIDFVATRGFAREVRKEQATMERTINTVQEIASLLAGYDVERVAELLAEHEGRLPEQMTSALRSLEENLRVYKAYLPKTCLPFDGDMPQDNGQFQKEDSDIHEDDPNTGSFISESETIESSRKPGVNVQVHMLSLSLLSTKATLLTLNIKDSLRLLEEDNSCFSQLFTSVLLKTLQATDLKRGMVDVFVGDRIHCSFNTSKQCVTHATSALHTATMLMQGGDEVRTHVNMGVATGKVLRGDMGCHVMRRFSMVGALVRDVLAIERAGRALGCDVLCNRLCFSDAECEHNLRLIPCKVELAANCEAEVLGELVVPTEVATAAEADEWMYQIGAQKDWDNYNQAVRRYLKGETSAEAVAAAAVVGNCALYPVHVTTSLDCLRLPSYTTKAKDVGGEPAPKFLSGDTLILEAVDA